MRRTKYTLGFKDEAVKQVIDRGHPVVDVAKPLGISESVLYTWVSKFKKADAPLAADHPADAGLQVILKCPHSHRRHRNHAHDSQGADGLPRWPNHVRSTAVLQPDCLITMSVTQLFSAKPH